MVMPGSWIGKTPTASNRDSEKESSLDEQIDALSKKLNLEEKPVKRHTRRGRSEKRTPHSKTRSLKEVSESTIPSRQKKTQHSSRSNGKSSAVEVTLPEHAIHQNIATGVFWCDCNGFKSHIEADAKHHMEQNTPKKKPFVRKEHLTNRPFAGNEALQALRDSLPEAEKFNPGKKPRNKENN